MAVSIMRLTVRWRFLLNTGIFKIFAEHFQPNLNSWWALNFISKNERVEVRLHNTIKTKKY